MINQQIQKIALFTVFLVVAGLSLKMLFPFLFSLFWAGILAGIFYPIYKIVATKTKNQNLGAFVTIVIVLLLVILPIVAISGVVVKEAVGLYQTINTPDTMIEIKSLIDQVTEFPIIQRLTENIALEDELRSILSAAASVVLGWFTAWTQNAALFVINLFVMLYALYYFLRDGKRLLAYLTRLLPLGGDIKKTLYDKFISTSRATLKGTIFLGIIQGVLGGITIFIVGVQSVFFLTLIMIILSIIPAVGALMILLPITLYMIFFGSMWQVVVLVLGMVVVSLSDNILRPALVGKDLNMHPLVIFLSTVGGLGLFGISGVVIGPIIAAFFVSILDIYKPTT